MKEYVTTQAIGQYGERLAARYLVFRGHKILAKNYRAGKYEIDLVSSTPTDIVFTEVKTRIYDSPEEAEAAVPPKHAVDADKQSFTRSAALSYLRTHRTKKRPRMDVMEVLLLRREGKKPKKYAIRHIKAAY